MNYLIRSAIIFYLFVTGVALCIVDDEHEWRNIGIFSIVMSALLIKLPDYLVYWFVAVLGAIPLALWIKTSGSQKLPVPAVAIHILSSLYIVCMVCMVVCMLGHTTSAETKRKKTYKPLPYEPYEQPFLPQDDYVYDDSHENTA